MSKSFNEYIGILLIQNILRYAQSFCRQQTLIWNTGNYDEKPQHCWKFDGIDLKLCLDFHVNNVLDYDAITQSSHHTSVS